MQRNWFKMIEGVPTEAPQQIETANGTLYNYNCDSNEEMLRADGYLPEEDIQILRPEIIVDIDI